MKRKTYKIYKFMGFEETNFNYILISKEGNFQILDKIIGGIHNEKIM